MNKILYTLIGVLFFSLLACEFKEDDIFDKSSAERMNEALQNYDKILNDAPNGWVMQYYVGAENRIQGGYCFLISFDNGVAKMATDEDIATKQLIGTEQIDVKYLAGDIVSSRYAMGSDQGPMLSFDTHNALLHSYMNPEPGNTNGAEGDYEFVIMDVKPEKIILKGKKWRKKVVLTQLDKDKNWAKYIADAIDVRKDISPYTSFQMFIGSKYSGMVNLDEKVMTHHNDGISEESRYTFFDQSIQLLAPVTLGGGKLENFTWDKTEKVFKTKAVAGDLELKPVILSYEQYIGNYTFTHLGRPSPATMTLSEKVAGQSYTVSNGALDFEFELIYEKGQLILTPQIVGTNNGRDVWITTVAKMFGTSLHNILPPGKLKTKWISGSIEQPNLLFISNGSYFFFPVTYFTLSEYVGTRRVSPYTGQYDTFMEAVFSKQ